MDHVNESPASLAGEDPGSGNNTHPNYSGKPPLKWKRVLRALLAGRSLNRFDAEREVRDHALHSTISNLQAKGLRISRREESVPGYMGSPTRVMRYTLDDPTSRELARELLGLQP